MSCQNLVNSFHIHILAHMLSKLVVLLFLKVGIALYRSSANGFFFQQIFGDGCIVEKTVDIGADAMVGLKDGFLCITDALMNLVALTRMTFELEGNLLGGLLGRHGSVDR